MPSSPIAKFLDFSGGLNVDATKTMVAQNQCSVLTNMYPLHGRLVRRPASERVALSGANPMQQCYGLFDYQDSDAVHHLIQLGKSTLYGINNPADASTAHEITNAESLVFPVTPSSNWRVVEFNNRGYAIRADSNFIVAFDLILFSEAGLKAPAAAPTLGTVGGVGVDAGDFYGVVTFYDSVNTSYESNPSPVSNKVTIAGANDVTWAGIPISTDPRCGGRRLYRTIANQTSEYYLVADIPNNTATTYSPDRKTLDNYGAQASFRNGNFPPKKWIDIANAYNRIWLTDGRYVYYSEDGAPESFYSTNFINIDPDSGEKIIGLSVLGDSLLVHRSRSLWAINQSAGIFPFLPQKVDETHGCEVTHSIQSAGGYSFWYKEASLYMTSGGVASDIATGRIRTILEAIPVANRSQIISGVFPTRNWYLLAVPSESSNAVLNRLLVYNYKDKNWTVFTYQARYPGYQLAPNVLATVQINNRQRLYAVLDNDSLWSDITSSASNVDDTVVVTAGSSSRYLNIEETVRLRGMDFDAPARLHAVVGGSLLCPQGTVTLNAYTDGNAMAVKTRDVVLASVHDWQRFGLSTRRNLAGMVEFEIQSNLAWIAGVVIEAESYERSGRRQ